MKETAIHAEDLPFQPIDLDDDRLDIDEATSANIDAIILERQQFENFAAYTAQCLFRIAGVATAALLIFAGTLAEPDKNRRMDENVVHKKDDRKKNPELRLGLPHPRIEAKVNPEPVPVFMDPVLEKLLGPRRGEK
ncbi:MAG: hypothetical protein HOO67_04555 [Candidatus Peribacteraceae bacterium]|nr:hypothetical protein [Candidatus Peribacteraceae bacterium]